MNISHKDQQKTTKKKTSRQNNSPQSNNQNRATRTIITWDVDVDGLTSVIPQWLAYDKRLTCRNTA